jgi:hypothetical protein
MSCWGHIPDYYFPRRKRGLKRKNAPKTSSAAPKQKKIKILTHRPKSYYMERAAELPALPAAKPRRTKAAGLSNCCASEGDEFCFFFNFELGC